MRTLKAPGARGNQVYVEVLRDFLEGGSGLSHPLHCCDVGFRALDVRRRAIVRKARVVEALLLVRSSLEDCVSGRFGNREQQNQITYLNVLGIKKPQDFAGGFVGYFLSEFRHSAFPDLIELQRTIVHIINVCNGIFNICNGKSYNFSNVYVRKVYINYRCKRLKPIANVKNAATRKILQVQRAK